MSANELTAECVESREKATLGPEVDDEEQKQGDKTRNEALQNPDDESETRDAMPTTTDEGPDGACLLDAAFSNFVDEAKWLLDQGCTLDAKDGDGWTALHIAAEKGHSAMAKLLVERGCSIDAQDDWGRTALHIAAGKANEDIVRLLLESNCSKEIPSNDGATALHSAARGGYLEVVKLLLDGGCSIAAENKEGVTPLMLAGDEIANTSKERLLTSYLPMVRTMLSRGGSFERIQKRLEGLDFPDKAVVLAVIRGWRDQCNAKPRAKEKNAAQINGMCGEKLSTVPRSVLDAGEDIVKRFFKDLVRSGGEHRKKLCFVGPGKCGKTKLIKKLMETSTLEPQETRTVKTLIDQPTLEPQEEARTIGVDLFSWNIAISQEHGCRCEVSIWDFAGEDVYQSAHSLFFSEEALYVVCVDLAAYSEVYKKITTNNEKPLDNFFDKNIYSRVDAICAANKGIADFILVGTKADLVEDVKVDVLVKDVLDRLNCRLDEELTSRKNHLDEVSSGLEKAETAVCEAVKNAKWYENRKLKMDEEARANQLQVSYDRQIFEALLKRKMVAVNSDTGAGIADFVKQLEETISSSEDLIPILPSKWRDIARQIHSAQDESESDRIKKHLVRLDVFINKIRLQLGDKKLTDNDVKSILRVLHNLGDILWFEKISNSPKDIVFLSPSLVIDFIRSIVNEDTLKTLGEVPDGKKSMQEVGRVTHDMIWYLQPWSKVRDESLMLRLKDLLYHLQIVYPAGGQSMAAGSDLIVPVYWKVAPEEIKKDESWGKHKEYMCWEYKFRNGFPDSLFDRFIVKSHDLHTWHCQYLYQDLFQTEECREDVSETNDRKEYVARISKWKATSNGGVSVIKIQVSANTLPVARRKLAELVVCLEQLLDSYPGLQTAYNVVTGDNKIDVRAQLKKDNCMLPPLMEWYVEKKWTREDWKLEDEDLSHDAVQTLPAKRDSDNGEHHTAWSLSKKTMQEGCRCSSVFDVRELRLQCQLSKMCFHEDDPIEVEVLAQWQSKCGEILMCIGKGLRNVLPKALADKYLCGCFSNPTPEFSNQILESKKIHEYISKVRFRDDGAIEEEELGESERQNMADLLNALIQICGLTEVRKKSKLKLYKALKNVNIDAHFKVSKKQSVWIHPEVLKISGYADEFIEVVDLP